MADILTAARELINEPADVASNQYVATGGLQCPRCKKTEMSSDPIDADGQAGTASVRCGACGFEGTELWELMGVEEEVMPGGGGQGMKAKQSQRTGRRLRLLGFDLTHYDYSGRRYHVKCSQCQALVINGVATHEHGCPNIRRTK